MYIINESESDYFIITYEKLIKFGVDEAKILIVHPFTETKFPFIEKHKLDMDYVVKYRDIHMTGTDSDGKTIKYSFDLPDKKMLLGVDSLQYLSERVTSISKKLGNLINKLTIVSADYNDLDSLEVLCGSIKGNFPRITTYEFKTDSFNIEEFVRLMESRCMRKFNKVSFAGESRHDKDIVK